MLAKLIMEISNDKGEIIGYHKSSIFQSILLEQADAEFAMEMHEQGLRPYSQSVFFESRKQYWVVNTYTAKAYNQLILPLLKDDFNSVYLEHDKIIVNIDSKEVKVVEIDDLFKDFYSKKSNKYINLKFVTPTSFKQDGKYIFYPDLRLIYQSLMKKCSDVAENIDVFDEETLDELVKFSEIINYQLKSVKFPMSSVNIPAFIGKIQIKVKGPDIMVNFANFLFEFGCYSGIGIKSAIGMGSIKIE